MTLARSQGGLESPTPGARSQEDDAVGTGSIAGPILRVFMQNRLAVIGLGIIVFMILFCFVGPMIYHTDQVHTNLMQLNQAPSAKHPLGTDEVGYDELGRLMLGGQSAIEVGITAALLASVWGTAWGAVSGFIGGWVDAIMMRVVDSILAIPYLLLVMVLASIFGPSIPVLIIVIALVSWLATARLVRGESLSIRVRDYVQAAQAFGSRNWQIVVRHVVRNTIGTIVVQTTFEVANAILLLAVVSYLGLGPPPPATNWGEMLSDGLSYIYDGYWWLIYPAGLAIVITVMGFNFVGDAVRDALDSRLHER